MDETKPKQKTQTKRKARRPGISFVTGKSFSKITQPISDTTEKILREQELRLEAFREQELRAKEQIRNALRDNIKNEDDIAATLLKLMEIFNSSLILEVIREEDEDAPFKKLIEEKLLTFTRMDRELLKIINADRGIFRKQGKPAIAVDERFLREAIREILVKHKETPFSDSVLLDILKNLIYLSDEETVRKVWNDEFLIHQIIKTKQQIELEKTSIPFRIIEEPLTPQNLALVLNALTELSTKFWLIAEHRFADLIAYTQTHDIRFAYEAGITIDWITYNSPLNFGLHVDRVVPGVAEAVLTVVDGVTQRKANLEKLELENQAAAQKIKEAEENLKQQQEMAVLEREKQEIALERLRLEIEKERQALMEQRLESQIKQIENALELAGKAVDKVYPNADAEMRPMLIQTVMNNILQLESASGLRALFITIKGNPQVDTGQ